MLIHIEPDRFRQQLGDSFDFENHLKDAARRGMRASLKSAKRLTGSLYVYLDFYPQEKAEKDLHAMFGYPLMPTTRGGLTQIQQRLIGVLDKINTIPLNPIIDEATKALAESQKTIKKTQQTMKSLNDIIASKEMKVLPQDMQRTLQELNGSMKEFQPGSPAYNKMVGDMQRLDQVLRELQPVLRTLDEKSNALVFEATSSHDLQPKKANK